MATTTRLYMPLQLQNEGDIRLVKIIHQEEGTISCQVAKANLQDNPQYVAISYTWGPSTLEEAARGITSTPSRSIDCNGHALLVSENLYSFLVRVAKDTKLVSRYMWIDIICIDQNNSLERTSQVNMMAAIYHSAESVTVWLGEEDEYTSDAFDLIKSLSKLQPGTLRKITPTNISSTQTLELLSPHGSINYWRCLAQLFQRNYFTRVWIIQEITLARERLAICGRHTIDWNHIVTVSHFFTVTSWTRWICSNGALEMAGLRHSGHTIPNLLEANRRTRSNNEARTMLYSLIRSRRFDASDARDKIYALLGVAGDLVTGKPRYQPVYGLRSTAETYEKAAVQILLDSDDLLLLAHAEGEVFRKTPGLPTWVPDWDSKYVVGLGVTGYNRFSAAGTLDRILHIDEENHTLVVRGKRIDSIVSSSETKAEILQGTPFPQLLQMLCALPQTSAQSPSEVFWRTLITDTAGHDRVHPASRQYGMAFSSWLHAKLKQGDNHVNDTLVREVLDQLQIDGLRSSSNDASYPRIHSHDLESDQLLSASDYETVFSHSPHLRAFLSHCKYFGIGSESLRKNDEVWVLAGSRIPLLLRPNNTGEYEIVGGAYVHGFMHGEALKLGAPFVDITLV